VIRQTQKANFVAQAIVVLLMLLILTLLEISAVKTHAAKRLVETAIKIRQVNNVMANLNVMNFAKSKQEHSTMASLVLTKEDVFLHAETALSQEMRFARLETFIIKTSQYVTTAKESQKAGSAISINMTAHIPTATSAETISLKGASNAMTGTSMIWTDVTIIAIWNQAGFAHSR